MLPNVCFPLFPVVDYSTFTRTYYDRDASRIYETGMRGAVSLAAALAIPQTIDGGGNFPQRDLIIFLTYAVILATLILQGLTLPGLIKVLGVEDDGNLEQRESKARILAARATLDRIEELRGLDWVRDDTADRMRGMYDFRIRRFSARFGDEDDGAIDEQSMPTSACGQPRPSAPRSSACATSARSTTRSCAASSATSISRTRAWRSDYAGASAPDSSAQVMSVYAPPGSFSGFRHPRLSPARPGDAPSGRRRLELIPQQAVGHEVKSVAGIARLVEHVTSRWTQKRPPSAASRRRPWRSRRPRLHPRPGPSPKRQPRYVGPCRWARSPSTSTRPST
jgi:hypothetical protein